MIIFNTRLTGKNITKIILLTAVSLTIAACGSTYKKGGWANSKADSDWDIDSAVCLQKSQRLSQRDLDHIKQIKLQSEQMNRMMQDTANNALNQGAASDAANVVSAFSAMFFESQKATAEDTVKDAKFRECLKDRGWGQG